MSESRSNLVAAVTGATGAIGGAIARQLAELGYSVALLGRHPGKCRAAVEEIIRSTGNQTVRSYLVDLSRQSSIRNLAKSWEGPLHILINNASAVPKVRKETPSGIEVQFATNVMGYYWMMEYFSVVMARAAPARIVNVASYWAGDLDLNDLEFTNRPYHNHTAYRQSKQAERMLTVVFSDRLSAQGITVNACHPGDVNSALSNSLGFGGSQSPGEGARTPVWVATADSLTGVTGKYFENLQEVPCRFAQNKAACQALYERCQDYSDVGFPSGSPLGDSK